MLLETDDELTLDDDDLTDDEETTDDTTDFCTLSDRLEAADEVSDTLCCTLSATLFSAFCTRLDCVFPSTFFSTLSATLFADRLALSMLPVAVFSTLDYERRQNLVNFSHLPPSHSPLTNSPTKLWNFW
jgi:hypothetical protein